MRMLFFVFFTLQTQGPHPPRQGQLAWLTCPPYQVTNACHGWPRQIVEKSGWDNPSNYMICISL